MANMFLDCAGVYKIESKTSGKFYIGSAINLRKRRNRHFSELNKNNHYNIHLQRAWNKYGRTDFTFNVVLICDAQNMFIYEQMAVDSLKPQYNIRLKVESNNGLTVTPERKKKVGDFFRGIKLSKSHIYNRSKSLSLNKLASNPMYGIQKLPSKTFRVVIYGKHLGCFKSLSEAQKYRTDYVNSLFDGG